MLIGLLSDTHIASTDRALPPQVKEAFQGVDLILHLGDVWIPAVLDELEEVAPVLVARGDDDMDEDLGNDSRMEDRQVLHIDGVTVWGSHIKPRYGEIVHPKDTNSYHALFNRGRPHEVVGELPDVVAFGHSHFAEIEHYKGVLLVNPGSLTMPGYIPKLGTVGFLTIEDGKAEARLLQLE